MRNAQHHVFSTLSLKSLLYFIPTFFDIMTLMRELRPLPVTVNVLVYSRHFPRDNLTSAETFLNIFNFVDDWQDSYFSLLKLRLCFKLDVF